MSTLAECIQGSSSAAFMKASEFSSLSSIPKLSSPPFLQTFFFSALFSILLPINLIAVMPLFFFSFFFFLHKFKECTAVEHITVILSNRECKRASFSGNFIFRNAGLH